MQSSLSPVYISARSLLGTIEFHLDQLLYLSDGLEEYINEFGELMDESERATLEAEIVRVAGVMEDLTNAPTDEVEVREPADQG